MKPVFAPLIVGMCIALFGLSGVARADAQDEGPAAQIIEPGAKAKAEISALQRRAEVQAAFAALVADRERNNAQMVTLNEIPAPPFGEGPRGERFAQMLREAGVSDVRLDDIGNVIGRIPGRGRGPVVALIAHLDTVFPIETDVKVRIVGDSYTAPGIGDNARGLVALLSIARAIKTARIQTRGDLLLIGSVGEEGLGDLRGMKRLFAPDGPKIDTVIAIDGGHAGRLVAIAVGSIRYKISISGPGGHSYGAFGLGNPHHALGRVIAALDEAALPITASGPKATYNVGRIGGGTSVNSIPFESWLEVDLRSHDPAKLAALDTALKAAVERGLAQENAERSAGEALTVKFDVVGLRPAGSTPVEDPLVQRAASAMEALGVAPALSASSTDANVPMAKGVPAITLSRGGESLGAHSLQETWRDVDSHVSLQVALITALAQAGMAR